VKIAIHRILCPVDFSANSLHALEYAIAFAAAHAADLTLLHVLEPPVYGLAEYPDLAQLSGDILDQLQASARKRLAALEESARKRHARTDSLFAAGTPFLEIIGAARARKVELIVMGTHGRSGLSHLIIGSVAERVVRKAPCPVLTVRHPQHEFVMP
jgi:universal stress protein A